MRVKWTMVACVGFGLICLGCNTLPTIPIFESGVNWDSAQADYEAIVVPFVDSHCASCHGDKRQRGELNLEELALASSIETHEEIWERAVELVRGKQMPPENRRQPEPDEIAELAAFVEGALQEVADAREPDPGRETVSRLNRSEYDNTIRDLLGVDFKPAADFPPDDSGYGFDNIGDVLTISPLLMEKYLDAAETIADQTLDREQEADPEDRLVILCDHEDEDHDIDCLKTIARDLLPRAYRRPVTKDELAEVVALGELALVEGDSFDQAVGFMIQAAIVSPQFLFQIERPHEPDDPDSVSRVDSFELASRLSYFLWSSMPDEELFGSARRHQIGRPNVLREQVARMLKDPKARAFAENFAGQWLEVRNLTIVDPDPDKFPTFDDELRESMAEETYRFFQNVMQQDLSILSFIDADFTYLDDRLSQHYGIGKPEGDGFIKVALAEGPRGGVLTQASVLTVSSYPTRTSPVLRGNWILQNILGTPTPEPPPNVPPINEDAVGVDGTLREQLEAHREDPGCASCHNSIDPLGFALENFDPIGAWRTHDGKFPVDTTGELPTGEQIAGAESLKSVLLSKKELFVRCLAEKMLTYALGRGVERSDNPVLDDIVEHVAANDYRFSALVTAITQSLPFQKTRGEGEDE